MSRGRYERKREKPKAGKVVLIILAVIAVLVVAIAVAGIIYYNSMLNRITHVEVPKIQYTTAPTTEPIETTEAVETTEATTVATEPHIASPEDYINILLVGQAARPGEDERHADTMIVMTLNKYEKTISMTSVLRDTLVQRGGSFKGHTYGGGKINAMYHMGYTWDGVAGSMAVMNQILYDNFGIEIDHNVEIDFDAFMEVVDRLGGIEVEIDQAEADYLNADDFCCGGVILVAVYIENVVFSGNFYAEFSERVERQIDVGCAFKITFNNDLAVAAAEGKGE